MKCFLVSLEHYQYQNSAISLKNNQPLAIAVINSGKVYPGVTQIDQLYLVSPKFQQPSMLYHSEMMEIPFEKYVLVSFEVGGEIPLEAISLEDNANLIGIVITSGKLHYPSHSVINKYLVPTNCKHKPMWFHSGEIIVPTQSSSNKRQRIE